MILTSNILPLQKGKSKLSLKSSNNGVYKILVAQKYAITKITGIITPKSIDTLEIKLGGAFIILNSTYFA
jgi:hypothetical protein